jgi:hypothetical protein
VMTTLRERIYARVKGSQWPPSLNAYRVAANMPRPVLNTGGGKFRSASESVGFQKDGQRPPLVMIYACRSWPPTLAQHPTRAPAEARIAARLRVPESMLSGRTWSEFGKCSQICEEGDRVSTSAIFGPRPLASTAAVKGPLASR